MSPYELGTGSNVLGGGGSRLPMGGNTDCGQRDSGYLAVSNVSVGGRLDKTGAVAGRCPGDEAVGKPRSQGVCEPALEPWRRGKGLWRKSQDFKPDRGNPAVRHYRGATGNVAMVGMRTRLAIERAGTVTPHLKRGAPVLYPNPSSKLVLAKPHGVSMHREGKRSYNTLPFLAAPRSGPLTTQPCAAGRHSSQALALLVESTKPPQPRWKGGRVRSPQPGGTRT